MTEVVQMHPFVTSLKALSFKNCFNPYRDRCPDCDRPEAPSERAGVLSQIMRRVESQGVDTIWIGRDLGYRGGRRTGLALTDDIHIAHHAARWGVRADRSTCGSAVAERTAAIIWRVLDQIEASAFLWNVFPFHPHEEGNPFSNRAHNRDEARIGEYVLEHLIELARPQRIIAIGANATGAASRIASGIPVFSVRHPSYGGQNQFLRQISELYSLKLSEAVPSVDDAQHLPRQQGLDFELNPPGPAGLTR